MATPNGLEPSTSSVTGWRANRLHHRAKSGGNNRARTYDLLLARQMLSQLSYAPEFASSVLRTSATWFIIRINPYFVKHFFSIFFAYDFDLKQDTFLTFPAVFQTFQAAAADSAAACIFTGKQSDP